MATLFNTKIKDTYQSLLKLEDNTILTTTSKNITDGLGNASPLYMSTTRIGIGTNSPLYTADIAGNLRVTDGSFSLTYTGNFSNGSLINAGTYPSFKLTNAAGEGRVSLNNDGPSGSLSLQANGTTYTYLTGTATGNSGYSYFLSLLGVGTATTLGAKLSIKGSGSTSATTSLLVQNSSANTLLQVLDNGLVYVGTGFTGLNFSGGNTQIFNDGGSGGVISLAMGGTTYLRVFQPKNAGSGITSGEINTITTPIDYGWSSGSASPNLLSLNPSINNTGAYSGGTFRGIYYNPTIFSLVGTNHIAIQTVTGDVLFGTTSGKATFGSGVAGTSYIEIKPGISNGFNRITFNDFDGGTVTRGGFIEISTYLAQINFGLYNAFYLGNYSKPYNFYMVAGTSNIIISTGNIVPTDSGALFQVKGTGSTSATTSLLVQNSSGLTALSITDDRTVSIGTLSVSGLTTTGVSSLTGQTNITGLSSIWQCQYAATGTVKPLSFSMQSGSFSANNSAIQFGFNYRASGGLFSQDIFQNILYDNTAGSVVTGFEWFTHQTQVGDASSQLALSLRGKTLSVGTNTPSASAILQADSTTQGVLFPRMTTAQKLAIASPVGGLQVFDTTLNQMSYYNGTAWINF
jgi:hypothetical protein